MMMCVLYMRVLIQLCLFDIILYPLLCSQKPVIYFYYTKHKYKQRPWSVRRTRGRDSMDMRHITWYIVIIYMCVYVRARFHIYIFIIWSLLLCILTLYKLYIMLSHSTHFCYYSRLCIHTLSTLVCVCICICMYIYACVLMYHMCLCVCAIWVLCMYHIIIIQYPYN